MAQGKRETPRVAVVINAAANHPKLTGSGKINDAFRKALVDTFNLIRTGTDHLLPITSL